MNGAAIEVVEKSRELGTDWEVAFLSLVAKPANRKGVLMKSENAMESHGRILHKNLNEGLLYCVPYEPFVEDAQQDYASDATIQYWAHNFLTKGYQRNIDYEHNYQPKYGDTVESFILRGTDPMFVDVRQKSWCAVIKLNAYGLSVADQINGISFGASRITKSEIDPSRFGCRIVGQSDAGFSAHGAYLASRIIINN